MSDGETPAPKSRAITLDAGILVPAGVVVTTIALLFGAYIWLAAQFDGVRDGIAALVHRVEKVEDRLDGTGRDRVTGADLRYWIAECRRLNPALSVPEFAHYEPK